DGDELRGDLRPGCRSRPLRDGAGGDRRGERDAVRPRGVLLQPRRRPHLAGVRGARIRDPRHQHGSDLHRGRSLRRHEGVRHRTRGIEVRDRGVARDQVPVHRRRRYLIVEQRDYHVYTGKLNELVRLYETEGIEIQQGILGGLIGVFTTDIGALSTYTSMWGYDSFAEREQRRARLQGVERCGRIDVLVNNAGLYASLPMRPFAEIPVEEWRRVMDVNVLSMFLTCRAVVPRMREQGGGRIVNISSGTPFRGVPFLLHYVTSKGAIVALTRALAKELGRDDVLVNCVAPGFTMSDGVREHPEAIDALRQVSVAARPLQGG